MLVSACCCSLWRLCKDILQGARCWTSKGRVCCLAATILQQPIIMVSGLSQSQHHRKSLSTILCLAVGREQVKFFPPFFPLLLTLVKVDVAINSGNQLSIVMMETAAPFSSNPAEFDGYILEVVDPRTPPISGAVLGPFFGRLNNGFRSCQQPTWDCKKIYINCANVTQATALAVETNEALTLDVSFDSTLNCGPLTTE
jgi:hypothetical protein